MENASSGVFTVIFTGAESECILLTDGHMEKQELPAELASLSSDGH